MHNPLCARKCPRARGTPCRTTPPIPGSHQQDQHLRRLLQTALEHAAGSLVHYRHTHALGSSELALFKGCVRCMLDVVLPYLTAAFARVFAAGAGKVDAGASAGLLRQLLAEM